MLQARHAVFTAQGNSSRKLEKVQMGFWHFTSALVLAFGILSGFKIFGSVILRSLLAIHIRQLSMEIEEGVSNGSMKLIGAFGPITPALFPPISVMGKHSELSNMKYVEVMDQTGSTFALRSNKATYSSLMKKHLSAIGMNASVQEASTTTSPNTTTPVLDNESRSSESIFWEGDRPQG